ncbi:hypothetical protein DASB73_008520 [Starmerella bacillaris]|uniref:Uncharacterized protein n=1 Tax=Starmerella bacillaris TaxID=1247836 RepID=A0AAV5RH93_STABA|nr:hypothetical protein DASB73_008520 [Starmerella bacillaris]
MPWVAVPRFSHTDGRLCGHCRFGFWNPQLTAPRTRQPGKSCVGPRSHVALDDCMYVPYHPRASADVRGPVRCSPAHGSVSLCADPGMLRPARDRFYRYAWAVLCTSGHPKGDSVREAADRRLSQTHPSSEAHAEQRRTTTSSHAKETPLQESFQGSFRNQ